MATFLSVALLLSAISVPLSFQAAAETPIAERSFNFGDTTAYGGGRIHAADMHLLGHGFKGLTGNSKDDTVNIMEIQGLFNGGDNSKNNAFWYFYNDKENASGFGYDTNGKQFLVTTCIDSSTAREIPTLDYSARNEDNSSTKTANDKPTTGVIITTDAVGGETEDTVSGISGKLRLATPVYTATKTGRYTKGNPVLDGTCGTTFLVAKKDNATIKGYDSDKFTGTVYQVVTVNLGYDATNGITLGAKASALQQFTNPNVSTETSSHYYFTVGSAYMKDWQKNTYLSQVEVASKSGSSLADLAVNGNGTALTDAEKNAVATYFQSLTGLKKAMDTNTDEYANRLDDYSVDYKVYSPETGKYRILLGLNINGYDEYCKENGDMPKKLAIALDGDYFNKDIETVDKVGKTKVTVDTPAYGIGSYNGVAINQPTNSDNCIYTEAKCANTLIADMTINYDLSKYYQLQAEEFDEQFAEDYEAITAKSYFTASETAAIQGMIDRYDNVDSEVSAFFSEKTNAIYAVLKSVIAAFESGRAWYAKQEGDLQESTTYDFTDSQFYSDNAVTFVSDSKNYVKSFNSGTGLTLACGSPAYNTKDGLGLSFSPVASRWDKFSGSKYAVTFSSDAANLDSQEEVTLKSISGTGYMSYDAWHADIDINAGGLVIPVAQDENGNLLAAVYHLYSPNNDDNNHKGKAPLLSSGTVIVDGTSNLDDSLRNSGASVASPTISSEDSEKLAAITYMSCGSQKAEYKVTSVLDENGDVNYTITLVLTLACSTTEGATKVDDKDKWVTVTYTSSGKINHTMPTSSASKQTYFTKPAYGIGGFYNHGTTPAIVQSVTLEYDYSAYFAAIEQEYQAENSVLGSLAIDALGGAILKNVSVGKAQSLRFGFNFSAIKSAVDDSSVNLKEYGIIIKSGTQKKETLVSSGQKVSITDLTATPLTDELTLVITNSDEYSHIRVSAVAYAVVEYNGTKYTVYSDNDDDKASDGVATKSVMGVMKAEMKSHTEDAAFTTAVDAANTECETSFDATVLNQTSTEENRVFIKWLFYYYFNPVQA